MAFVPAPPADSAASQQQPQPQQQRLVSGSADKTLRLWEAATRRTLKISRKLPSEIMCLAVTRWGFTRHGTEWRQMFCKPCNIRTTQRSGYVRPAIDALAS